MSINFKSSTLIKIHTDAKVTPFWAGCGDQYTSILWKAFQ